MFVDLPLRLSLEHLCRTYGGLGGVRDVSLHVPSGAIAVLAGSNGAGKTTTLAALAGLTFAQSGTLTLDGTPIPLDRASPRPGLGYLPDQPVLDPNLTAWQWASFTTAIKGVEWPAEWAGRAADALRLRPDDLDGRIGARSFGTQRKIALWVEFLTTTGLLVLDEPLVGLDPDAIQGFHALAQEFVSTGRSILYSTHLLREAEALATHVAIIRQGALSLEGPLDTVRGEGTLAEAFQRWGGG